MKTTKMTSAAVLVTSALVATYVCKALAGFPQDKFVTIDTVARVAEGSFGSARNSTDNNQFIYCTIDTFEASMQMICRAKNNATTPVDIQCSTTDVNLISGVQKLSTDAEVKFTWNASGTCTSVTIDHSSKWPVKNP